MQVTRRRGVIRLRFGPGEAAFLADLLARAGELMAGEPDNPGVARLFPAAYLGADQAEAAAEFRRLTEDGLRDERAVRLAACQAELAGGPAELELDAEAGTRWIKVLNDLRLISGTNLGITEDDSGRFDPEAPDAQQRASYLALTWLQDRMVTALMH